MDPKLNLLKKKKKKKKKKTLKIHIYIYIYIVNKIYMHFQPFLL